MSSIAGSRWLSYDFVRGLVPGFLSAAQARVAANGLDTYTFLPAVLSVPLLQDLLTWSQVREEAAHHFHHVQKFALPDAFPNTPYSLTPPLRPMQLGLVLLIQITFHLLLAVVVFNLSYQPLVQKESRRLFNTTLMTTL